MRRFDVVCATLNDVMPKGLEHLPGDWTYARSLEKPWATAANHLLDRTKNDVLHLDDDIEILPCTFDILDRYYDQAEIFGFSLIGPCGNRTWIQSAGHSLMPLADKVHPVGLDDNPFALTMPVYVAHVGTCCCYIKKEVLAAGVRFPSWPGLHHEDIAFCLEAWLKGFRVMRLPSVAIHHGAQNGAGAIKGNDPEFHQKRQINEKLLFEWMEAHCIAEKCIEGVIPMGARPCWQGWK